MSRRLVRDAVRAKAHLRVTWLLCPAPLRLLKRLQTCHSGHALLELLHTLVAQLHPALIQPPCWNLLSFLCSHALVDLSRPSGALAGGHHRI